MASKQLRKLAGRIATLMGSSNSLKLRDCLDYLPGALYALFRAEQLGYKDRSDPLPPDYWNAPLERAKRMGQGSLRTEGKWAASLYFNSALVRIATDYHRLLTILVGKDYSVRTLATQVRPPFRYKLLDKVNREVNVLKHEPKGLAHGRTVKFTEAVEALEELVSLVESRRASFAASEGESNNSAEDSSDGQVLESYRRNARALA